MTIGSTSSNLHGAMMSNGLIALLLIVMCHWPVGAVAPDGQRTSLEEIKRAIADAQVRDVLPYPLRHSMNTSEAVSGFVYTPYVRIARFARDAMRKGRTLGPEDIPTAVSESVVHVVMRAPPEDSRTAGQPVLIAALVRPRNASPPERSAFFDSRNLHPPLRVETGHAAAAVLDGLAFEGVPIVGVFPLSVREQELVEFCAYQDFASGAGTNGHNVVAGFIRGPLR